MSVLDDTKEKMAQALDHLQEELQNIRTGRANPGLVVGLQVEVYGTQMRLQDIANVTAPEPRQLLITPYDGSNAPSIGKSIEKANLGFQCVVDGNAVRITVPPMDEALRGDMVKLCHRKKEECKISVRNVRRDSNEFVRKQKADGEISEDIMKKDEKEIQDLTDKFCKDADDMAMKKEEEITTI